MPRLVVYITLKKLSDTAQLCLLIIPILYTVWIILLQHRSNILLYYWLCCAHNCKVDTHAIKSVLFLTVLCEMFVVCVYTDCYCRAASYDDRRHSGQNLGHTDPQIHRDLIGTKKWTRILPGFIGVIRSSREVQIQRHTNCKTRRDLDIMTTAALRAGVAK